MTMHHECTSITTSFGDRAAAVPLANLQHRLMGENGPTIRTRRRNKCLFSLLSRAGVACSLAFIAHLRVLMFCHDDEFWLALMSLW